MKQQAQQTTAPVGNVQETNKEPIYTERFSEVQQQEQHWLRRRREAVGMTDPQAPLVGLGLSGGGIRSATFNLGVLQGLSRRGLLPQVDYLSSVSGGGYIGSCLTWLRAQIPFSSNVGIGSAPLKNKQGTVLDWLRAHGNYLINGKGYSGWTLGAAILAGTLLNLVVLLPIMLGVMAVASEDWISMAWPEWLHLPGAEAIEGHDGFLLLIVAGLACLGLFLLSILLFALTSGSQTLAKLFPENRLYRWMGMLLATGFISIAIGLLPAFSGLEHMTLHYLNHLGAATFTRHASYLLPIASGIFSVLAARSRSGSSANTFATVGLALLVYGFLTALFHVAAHTLLTESTVFFSWLALSLLLAVFCNINSLSLHCYYRGRLKNAYMPVIGNIQSAPESGKEPTLDYLSTEFRLTQISPESGGPLQLINTTLNTSSSRNEKRRSRKGESFTLSPLYCGSTGTGYRACRDFMQGNMTLANAFAISGAAIDPNTYATASRPISFLMTLINARLGFWTRNPRMLKQRRGLPQWYKFMFREMLGVGLSETKADIHLSDGGHFDNLGLYELVRRQCRYILISDAGADPETTLSDLGQTIQRVRADFLADVVLDITPLTTIEAGVHSQSYALGKVTYADGSMADLLYIKALINPQLSADTYAYWRTNAAFPDQSTADQFFDERQFESYRQLGLDIINHLAKADPASIADWFGSLPVKAQH